MRSLIQVVHLTNERKWSAPREVNRAELLDKAQQFTVDFKEVRGQQSGKSALEAASAGGHNILMIGQTRTCRSLPAEVSAASDHTDFGT